MPLYEKLQRRFRRAKKFSAKALRKANKKRLEKRRIADAPKTLTNWTPVYLGEPIRVVFFVLSPQIWPTLEPIWRLVSKDKRFHTKVVLLENTNLDDGLSGLLAARSMLEERHIPFAQGSSFSLQNYMPHIAFLPLPYPDLYPKNCNPNAVRACGARVAYVPYGLEVGGGAYNARYQYDETVIQNAWRVFARSQKQLQSFGRHCMTGNAHVVITGHPRADSTPIKEGFLDQNILDHADDRKIVVWAPHFSVKTRRKWSSFLENYAFIQEEIKKRPNLFFVLRPHPLLERTLQQTEGWTAETARNWFLDISSLPNVHLDKATEYWPSFNSSAALMTDSGSFLVEYLLTEKPICHLQGNDAIGLTDEAHELKAFHPGRSEREISTFLDQVEKGDDAFETARRDAKDAYFGTGDGQAGQRILDEMIRGIGDKPYVDTQLSQSEKHKAAYSYWKSAQTTFLAPPEYYDRQEELMVELLARHKPSGFAVDIGCGNGRYTEVLAKLCEHVEGVDPGAALIEEARTNAVEKSIGNLEYRIESLERVDMVASYDLVCCMGVLSGLIDNDAFLRAVRTLVSASKPGGMLLLKDSLSVGTAQATEWNGYTAVYRNIDDYLSAFRTLGLELIEEVTIAPVNEKNMTNRFFLFRRNNSSQ